MTTGAQGYFLQVIVTTINGDSCIHKYPQDNTYEKARKLIQEEIEPHVLIPMLEAEAQGVLILNHPFTVYRKEHVISVALEATKEELKSMGFTRLF